MVGIRKETKNEYERRVPLNPIAVETLIKKGYKAVVQPSDTRIYTNDEYENTGAILSDDLSCCDLVLAVKEIPIDQIIPGIPHLFFSHTIKGQESNMPLLQSIIDTKTTLLDYEKIINKNGQRLVFFGKYAGYAGMVDTLWGAGQRLKNHNKIDSVFQNIKRAFEYESVDHAIKEIGKIGDEIRKNGLPDEITPFNIFILGYGSVASGCMDILSGLPIKEIEPDDILQQKNKYSNKHIYLTVFKEKHLVNKKDGSEFDLQDYYSNGTEYCSKMGKYLPFASIYMNAIYWAPGYPIFLNRISLKKMQSENQKLIIIGDITCDIDGSVEATVKSTEPGTPIFIYDAYTGKAKNGLIGEGFADMAVDNLPCEFARESSDTFSSSLMPFMEALLLNDYTKPIVDSILPLEIKSSCIAHQGKLEEEFSYLYRYLNAI